MPIINTRPYSSYTDEQLQELLKREDYGPFDRSQVVTEIEQRRIQDALQRMQENIQKLTKPHWTLVPSFWAVVLALVFAAIAAWPVIQGWIQSSPPANTSSNSLPQ